MAGVVEGLGDGDLVGALEANMVAFWRRYGEAPGRELEAGEELVRVMTGIPHPLFNGVYRARLAADAVAEALAATRAAARRWRAPLFWWVAPGTQPADLGELLRQGGFVFAGKAPGMAIELPELAGARALPPGLTVAVVKDEPALAAWAEVAGAGTGFAAPVPQMVRQLELEVGLESGGACRQYLGYLDDVPVAASCMVLAAGVAGIYAVATLPAARRKGIGAALTHVPLLDAAAAGYKVGTLQASEMGYPVYKGMGFRDVCGMELYLLRG